MPTQVGENQYVGDMDTFNCRDEGYEYGSVPVATGVNQLNETVYSCQDISGLFGGGLWDTWIGEWITSQETDDIDRVLRMEEAQAFQELLEGIENGTKDWRDLQAFELDFLLEKPEMVEYYDRLLERTIYDAYVDDFGTAVASGDAEAISAWVDEYTNAGIKDNLYATAPGPTLPPRPAGLPNLTGDFQTQMIKAICQGSPVCAGVDICFEPGQTDCIDPSSINDLWEDVVSHVYIVFGDLGIPIPDLPIPLPGILKLPTLGNIWDKIQTTVSDIANSEDDCRASVPTGEDPDEYCSTSNRITRAIQNGSTEIVTKAGEVLEDVLGTVVGAVTDPVETAGKIWDWIKGAYGDDPRSAPPWVWQVIVASEVYGQPDVRDAIEDVVGVDIDDDGTIGTPTDIPFGPDNPNPDCTAQGLETAEDGTCVPATPEFDCASVFKSGGTVTDESQCGGCLQGYDPDGQGGCIEAPIECPGEQVYNDLTGQCEDPEPGFVEGDPCKTEAGESGTYNAEGGCVADPVEPTPCANNATTESGCERCSDGSLPSEHENGDCSQPEIVTETSKQGDPCKTEDGLDGTLQPVQSLGFGPSPASEELECVPNQTEPTETGFDCNQPRPDGGFGAQSWDRYCAATRCLDGSIKDNPEGTNCPEYVAPEVEQPEEASPCDQQNRVTREDGSCGECKPGFTPDPEGFDQCIQAPPECNDCSCAEYASANPEECTTCPEGQSYCESTGQCEAEGACPAAEEAEEGGSSLFGGGGFSGGGANLFEPYSFAVSADPTLLGSKQFPITDFLAGIFTNSTGGRNA